MSDELTAEQVKAMLERAEASAPGPWAILPPILKDDDPGHWNIQISAPDYCLPAHCYGNKYRAANAAFIASTRADVPALCRSWLAQDAELAALRAKIDAALALADTGSAEHRERFLKFRKVRCGYCGQMVSVVSQPDDTRWRLDTHQTHPGAECPLSNGLVPTLTPSWRVVEAMRETLIGG